MAFLELIFDPLSYVFKFLGVTVLYFVGRVASFFNPTRIAYSFKTIWNKDFDKQDTYRQFAEEFSQKLIGAMLLGVIMLFIFL